jgi:thioredoxin-like negative regulator of GroEL
MKKTGLFILMLLSAGLFAGAKLPEPPFPWYGGAEGYKAAVETQKSSQQPILLYFYTTWCPYCRGFEKKVLHTPEVEKALSGTVRVKIDVDFEKELAEKFGIESFPRVIVVSALGKRTEIHTERNIQSFLQQIRKTGIRTR